MKQKYVIIGHYTNDKLSSMELFDRLITDQLKDSGNDVEVWKPLVVFGAIIRSAHGIGKWLGYLDKFLLFPIVITFKLARSKPETLYVLPDHSHGIYLPLFRKHRHVVHVHDLIAIRSYLGEFPHTQLGKSGKIYQSQILKGLLQAEHFICISSATRDDLLRIGKSRINPQKVKVVWNELNHNYTPVSKEVAVQRLKANGQLSPFFLHVGNGTWYKNRHGVIRLYHYWLQKNTAHPPVSLVIVGESPSNTDLELVENLKLSTHVRFMSGISTDELEALYSMAELLLFPSLHEGFGWPLIEAFACACPVITTDKAPMSEITNGLAQLLPIMPNPDNDPAFEKWLAAGLEQMNRIVSENENGIQRSDLVAQAAQFRKGTAFPKYLEIYHQIPHPTENDTTT